MMFVRGGSRGDTADDEDTETIRTEPVSHNWNHRCYFLNPAPILRLSQFPRRNVIHITVSGCTVMQMECRRV